MTALNRLQTTLFGLILLLALFVFSLGYLLSPKLVSAQSDKEANTNCVTTPDYKGGSFSSRFDNPEDDCSIGYYPIDYNHDRFKDFIDHANLQCISSPEIVFNLVGDLERDWRRIIGGKSSLISETLNLEKVANIALGAEIEAQNPSSIPTNIRRLVSYFDDYNNGLTQNLCEQQGSTDYRSCVREMGACLSGSGPCRENYLLTGSTMSRLTSKPQQFQYYRDRCNHIIGSVSNSMDQANPREHNTWLDQYGTNLQQLCSELPESYDGFQALPPETQTKYASIPPSVSLERGFLIVSRYPQDRTNKHVLGWFFNTLYSRPKTEVVPFFIAGLVGATTEAKREFQLYMPLAMGQKALEEIEFITYKPLNNNTPMGENTPETAIIQPSEYSRYDLYWPIIDKINQSDLVCSQVSEGETQFAGGLAETKSKDGALINWGFQLPDTKEKIEDILNKDSYVAYQAWLMLPKYFSQLQELHGENDAALSNAFLKLSQVNRKSRIDIPQPLNRSQTNVTNSVFSRFTRDDTCTLNPDPKDCIIDPETGLFSCTDQYTCEHGEIGVKTGDDLSSVSIPGGETVHFMGLELGRRFFQKLDNTREYFASGCYYQELSSRFPVLNQVLGREASALGSNANCPQTLDFSSSLACQTHPAQLNPGVCSFDPKLGFNFGYGHTDPGACQDSVGKPVTFLVELGWDANKLQEFANCYDNAERRIIRIKNIFGGTTRTELETAAANFNQVFKKSNDIVVLGNELNNLSAEYTGCSGDLAQCGRKYAEQFSWFNAVYNGNLAAAPLDTLNAHYDASPFLNGAMAAYRAADYLAANVYQAQGCAYDEIRCTINSYQWVKEQVRVDKPVILTEFGLAPGIDLKLDEVLNFIKTNIPQDVVAVTPLIRNVCGDGGEWLRFNCLDLINSKGEGVNAGSSGPPGGTGTYPSGSLVPSEAVIDYIKRLTQSSCVDPVYIYATLVVESPRIVNLDLDTFQAASADNWWQGRCGPYSKTASDPMCVSLYCYDTCAAANCQDLCQDSSGVKWARRYSEAQKRFLTCQESGWTPRNRINPDPRENSQQSSTTVMGAGQFEEVTYEDRFLSGPRTRQPGDQELMARCDVDLNIERMVQFVHEIKSDFGISACTNWSESQIRQVANRYNLYDGYSSQVLKRYDEFRHIFGN